MDHNTVPGCRKSYSQTLPLSACRRWGTGVSATRNTSKEAGTRHLWRDREGREGVEHAAAGPALDGVDLGGRDERTRAARGEDDLGGGRADAGARDERRAVLGRGRDVRRGRLRRGRGRGVQEGRCDGTIAQWGNRRLGRVPVDRPAPRQVQNLKRLHLCAGRRVRGRGGRGAGVRSGRVRGASCLPRMSRDPYAGSAAL